MENRWREEGNTNLINMWFLPFHQNRTTGPQGKVEESRRAEHSAEKINTWN
jgi:hypothetical protein